MLINLLHSETRPKYSYKFQNVILYLPLMIWPCNDLYVCTGAILWLVRVRMQRYLGQKVYFSHSANGYVYISIATSQWLVVRCWKNLLLACVCTVALFPCKGDLLSHMCAKCSLCDISMYLHRCRVWRWMSLMRPCVIKQHKNSNSVTARMYSLLCYVRSMAAITQMTPSQCPMQTIDVEHC